MDYSGDTHAQGTQCGFSYSVIHPIEKQKHTAGWNMANNSVEKEVRDFVIMQLCKNNILSFWGLSFSD